QLESRQSADDVAFRLFPEGLNRLLEPELRAGRNCDREPEIEIVVAPIILRDAGVRVDRNRGLLDVIGIDFRRHKTRSISEGVGVELRGELADCALALQALGALDDF